MKAKQAAVSSAVRRTREAVGPSPVAGKVTPRDTNPFIKPEERFVPQDSNGNVAHWPKAESRRELPDNYGDNTIWLLVRDPRWIYSYWEIQRDHEERALRTLGGNRHDVRSILRVYVTSHKNGEFYDIELQGLASDWYLEAEPNTSYVVEIGLLHRDGRFVALARSNEVTTPREGMSDILDEEWMAIDFDKMYALSGGFSVGLSSAELQRQMIERLKGSVTSGSGGASPARIQPKRDFWFELDCELVVYGATEPDATVTIQGKKIQLRPDGTFTIRYALPDGRIVVDATAESADGVEERKIIPIIERKTRRPETTLKDTFKENAPSSAKPRS